VALRVVADRPVERRPGAEPAEARPPGLLVADGGEPAGAVAAGPPARGGVLDVGVEHVPAAEQADGDRGGGAPLVERVGGEEADQGVELAALAGEAARGGQGVLERFGLDLAGVVGRLGGGGEEAADLARLAAGVRGAAVAEVLLDGALRRDGGPVVDAL